MTTNQLTYMQLQEQARANRASEEIRQEQVDVSRLTAIPTAEKLRTEVEIMNAKLPLELRLTEEQITKVSNEAERILTEDLSKRKDMGDTSYMTRLAPRFVGQAELEKQSWDSMTATEKLGYVESAIRQGLDFVGGLFHGSKGTGSDVAGDVIKIAGMM